jgi:hypothetical protein
VGEKVGESSSDTVGDRGERCGGSAGRRWAAAAAELREIRGISAESLRLGVACISSARCASSSVSLLFSTCVGHKDAELSRDRQLQRLSQG